MSNEIEIACLEPYDDLGLHRWMPALAARVLASEQIDDSSVSVVVTDDKTVQALNRQYRGFDQPTDVLSFGLSGRAKPAVDDEEPFPEFVLPPDTASQLGEVVISCETAETQAIEHGRTTDMELAHLLIHGILHLLGYDHYEHEEEREMRAREDRLMSDRIWERTDPP